MIQQIGAIPKRGIEFRMFPQFRLLGRFPDPLIARTMKKEFRKITRGIKQTIEKEYLA
jgi:hypothetical protein